MSSWLLEEAKQVIQRLKVSGVSMTEGRVVDAWRWALQTMGRIAQRCAPSCYGWNEDHFSSSFPLLTPSQLHASGARRDGHADFAPLADLMATWLKLAALVDFLAGQETSLLIVPYFAQLCWCVCVVVCMSVNLSAEGKFTLEYCLHSAKQRVSQLLRNSTEACKWSLDSSHLSEIVNSPKYQPFQLNVFRK